MQIGYARVSTGDQSLALQTDALERAGCARIFRDAGVSGVARDRPGLARALKALKCGDVLVVWRLDRLARSVQNLADLIGTLDQRDIGLRSLCEHIDTVSATGRLTLHLLAAFAEFERALIIERTRAGMDAAKSRGIRVGRPPKLQPVAVAHARQLVQDGLSVPATAGRLGVARSTLYRAFAAGAE